MDILTQTRVRTFLRCRQAHAYRFELGIVREPSGALRFGQWFHWCVDSWNRGADYADITAVVDQTWGAYVGAAQTPDEAHDRGVELVKLKTLFRAYCNRWGEADLHVVASELPFDTDLIDPETRAASKTFRHQGKIDALIKLADGRLAVMETKTTGEDIGDDAEYWKRLRLDTQISSYVVAARKLGHDVSTILYDVIRKPLIEPLLIDQLDAEGCKIVVDEKDVRVYLDSGKPRQSPDAARGWRKLSRRQTPDEYGERLTADVDSRPAWYFQRREIPRLQSDIEECESLLWDVAKDIRDAQLKCRHYRNVDACRNPFPCEYIPLCYGGVDITVGLPEGFTRIENRFPELENANDNSHVATAGGETQCSASDTTTGTTAAAGERNDDKGCTATNERPCHACGVGG